MRFRQPTIVLAGWTALGVAVLILHAAGEVLPAPPLGAPSAWWPWMMGRDPVVVAFAVARLLALVAAWYGLVVTVAGVGLRLLRAGTLACAADRLTVVPLRRLVAATVTVGITVGPVGAPAGATTTMPPTTTVWSASGSDAPEGPPATVTMHRLDDAEAEATPPALSPARVWTVEAGQCFWSIAEVELGRVLSRRPSPAEVVPYWQRLIEANRGVLADPQNADLIFPGQVFALPPP